MPIGARLSRFRRNIAASLDGEGERVSFITKKGSVTLRRLGETLRTSFENQASDDLEDDPIAAFLISEERQSPEAPVASPGVSDMTETLASAGQQPVQDPASFDPILAGSAPQDQQPPPAPPTAEVQTQAATQESLGMVDILQAPSPAQSAGDAAPPTTQGPPTAQAAPAQPTATAAPGPAPEAAPAPPDPEPALDGAVAAMPTFDNLSLGPDAQAAAAEPAPATETVTAASGEGTVAPDVDGQGGIPAESPPAEAGVEPPPPPMPETGSPAQPPQDSAPPQEDQPQTATSAISSSGPMFADEQADKEDEEQAEGDAAEEQAPTGGGGGDSLLDIFRAEDVEENPVATLAKTLSDVDINSVLTRAKEVSETLQALANSGAESLE